MEFGEGSEGDEEVFPRVLNNDFEDNEVAFPPNQTPDPLLVSLAGKTPSPDDTGIDYKEIGDFLVENWSKHKKRPFFGFIENRFLKNSLWEQKAYRILNNPTNKIVPASAEERLDKTVFLMFGKKGMFKGSFQKIKIFTYGYHIVKTWLRNENLRSLWDGGPIHFEIYLLMKFYQRQEGKERKKMSGEFRMASKSRENVDESLRKILIKTKNVFLNVVDKKHCVNQKSLRNGGHVIFCI
ncbi:hypothetical protein J6590_105290 [Homalodisca vitripennis]|nr:hypothetical protein J6590_105290 [Homalodisca vitripennis]